MIRPFDSADLDALYRICLRTGAAGGDATDLVNDGRLIGEIWAAPYALLEPDLAFVLEDTNGEVVGYVLGSLDAVGFEDRCESEWWPAVRHRHVLVENGDRIDDLLIALIHNRPQPRHDLVTEFPSELHIDLLPEAQGRGHGRRMIETLLAALADLGSLGVHLGVSAENLNAIGFYRALGFVEFDFDGVSHTFVRSLTNWQISARGYRHGVDQRAE